MQTTQPAPPSANTYQHALLARPVCFRLSREQNTLQRLLHRAGCPPALELGEYTLGLLGEGRASDIEKHLAYCSACRSEREDLREFLARLRQPVADAAEQAARSLRTVVARLAPGALGGPAGAPVPALRGLDDAQGPAPVVYDADDILVTLDSWTERVGQSGRVVAGLVVGAVSFRGAEALMDPEGPPNKAPIDDLGNFVFANVSPGIHHLTLRIPDRGIQVEIDELAVK